MKHILFIALLFSGLAHAGVKEVGNGGDMCEDRIKIVRDDIESWILNGGSAALTFPDKITLTQYNSSMLDQITKAKISCVDEKIMIGQAEKTCMNFVDVDGASNIKCNIGRFMNDTSESDQYVLVHHEYAGLAGFEVNIGDDSNYQISNQISGYLVDQVVKKLAVKPAANIINTPADPKSCTADGNVYQCGSLDGKYSLVLDDSPYYKSDFPDGIGSINLCTFTGLLKLNGQVLTGSQYQVEHQVSSINGLSVIAPDKSVVQVNAELIVVPSQWHASPPLWSALPDVEAAEILVVDSKNARNVSLYLLGQDGVHFSEVNLFCSLIL